MNSEKKAQHYWRQSLAMRARAPAKEDEQRRALRLAVENKIITGLEQNGVNEETLRNLNFAWNSNSPFDVFITIEGKEAQIEAARRFFLNKLASQHGRHNSFVAHMGQIALSMRGLTAISLQSDSFFDLAKAVGIGPQALVSNAVSRKR